jgi:hypothetical protein
MKARQISLLVVVLLALSLSMLSQQAVPKYDPAAEKIFKGSVEEVRERQCPMSRGVGSHVMLKLGDGSLIEVHLAPAKFVKVYELTFAKGDQLEVTGTKVKFEDVDTIFAREVKRGNDVFVFRDKEGHPVW